MMNIDIRTLYLTSTFLEALLSLYLLLVWINYRKDFKGILQLVWASAITTLGNFCLALRDIIDPFWTLVMGNFLIILGIVLVYISLSIFFGRKHGKLFYIVLFVIPIAAFIEQIIFIFIMPDVKARIVLISAFFLLPAFFSTLLLIEYRKQSSLPGVLLTVTLAANVLVLIIRISMTLAGDNSVLLTSMSGINLFAIVLWVLSFNIWPLGFALLISHRIQEREQILNREKTILLRELHHRTKNNMQVISAFLGLQRNVAHSSEVKDQLLNAENRIRTISLVHEKLYQSKNFSKIFLDEYIRDLNDLTTKCYCVGGSQIGVKIDVEKISVVLDIAVPIGLVINELLSNIYKHAFPDSKGNVMIDIRKKGQENISVIVKDNGIGVPKDFDYYNLNSLGLQTIINIVENQLSGNIRFESNNGFSCYIEFRSTLYGERV